MAESALARMPLPARILISAGLLVLGGLAYYVVFYSDVSSQIERTKSQRFTLEGSLADAKKAESAYQKDLEELAKRRERERELNKVLPPDTEYPAFLSSVQSVANTSGVDLTAWTPQPEAKEKYYARVPMKIQVTGRFHQIRQQLAHLGFPVKGDVKYGARRKNHDRSIHLHAFRYTIQHGNANKISIFDYSVPDDALWNLSRPFIDLQVDLTQTA